MKTQEISLPHRSRFALFPRTIQQRLPFLIFFLLLAVVLLFTVTSYIGMKNTSLNLGRERLTSLSLQLGDLLQKSSKMTAAAVLAAAKDEKVVQVLADSSAHRQPGTIPALEKMHQDSLVAAIDLLDLRHTPIVHIGKRHLLDSFTVDSQLIAAAVSAEHTAMGKIRAIGDSMYFPVVAAVMNKNQHTGYLICWRKILSNPAAIEQLSKLLGTKATIYLGNRDGSLWTDMIRPIDAPPVAIFKQKEPVTYTKSNKEEVMGALQPIGDTPWLVLVELSRNMVVEGASRFQYWITMMGILLIIGGSLAGWSLSRQITRPLHSLMNASAAIANGDYTLPIPDNRQDEIGRLARSFKEMTLQVQQQHQQLENKVHQRTAELEASNRELEAFSYSVSHDLRAPLRAISGYASMLSEDYESKLDNEGKRLLNVIMSNARSMGMLIDDLIAFSKIGRKELIHRPVDMKVLAQSSVRSLIDDDASNKYTVRIDDLPMCYGDSGLLNQVWMNLIGNAIKYSSKSPAPFIHIGSAGDPAHPEYFVKDNGVGFDMKYANKLFGVFQRLHSAEEFEGTGIGLALVQRIISRHGGRIWAQGVLGEGATFFFSVPNSEQTI